MWSFEIFQVVKDLQGILPASKFLHPFILRLLAKNRQETFELIWGPGRLAAC